MLAVRKVLSVLVLLAGAFFALWAMATGETLTLLFAIVVLCAGLYIWPPKPGHGINSTQNH